MTNKTQCPNCLTVYFITDEQFEKSKGKVRCGTCRQPFVASFLPSEESKVQQKRSFDSGEASRPSQQKASNSELPREAAPNRSDVERSTGPADGQQGAEPSSDDRFTHSTKSFFEEPLSEASLAELMRDSSDEASVSSVSYSFGFEENLHSELTIEIEGRETQADKAQKFGTADLIGQVDELIDEKLGTEDEREQAEDGTQVESDYEGFRIEENTFSQRSSTLGDGSLSTEAAFSGDELLLDKPFMLDRRSPLHRVQTWVFAPILVVAIVAMLALLVYQLWLRQAVPILDDEQIAETLAPYASVVKEKVDKHFDWQVPVRRDLANLRLVSARVEPHPDRPSTTLLKVSVANKSSIAQPFPWLELVLTDENGRLVSRRALPPTDYIHNNRLRDVVRANELRRVTIELLAFPRQAHGYELKILNR